MDWLQISGLKEIVIIDTAEGIVMDVSFTAKVFGQNDHEYTDIKIKGIPNIHTRQDNLPGYELTCTTVMNRIPDVINGKPGLITADSLPFPQFCVHPLHTYLVVNG